MTNLTEVTDEQLKVLKDFATSENKELVSQLEDILEDVAKTGQYIFPWHFMKPLYVYKLDKVTAAFLKSTPPLKSDGTEDEAEIKNLDNFRNELLEIFDKFICAPFTIQRVSELLTNPKKHYKSTAKFFRGLEKNILVVSTINHIPFEQRPILKRSLVEDIPETNQNGYIETEIKPPVKKSVPDEEAEASNTSLERVVESDTTNNEAAVKNETNTNPQESLESMLLCKEKVNDDDAKSNTQVGELATPSKEKNTTVKENEVNDNDNELSNNLSTESTPPDGMVDKEQVSMEEG